jgi:hypothetical protein
VNAPPRSKLEQKFDRRIHDETLKPLLPVIQGLMRFRPSDRISISQALDMVSSISGSANTDEEAEDGMDDRGLSTLSSYLCIAPANARVEVA